MRAVDKSSGSSSVSTWHQTEQRRCTLLISSWQKQLLAAPHSQQPLLWDPSLTQIYELWEALFLLLFSYSFFAVCVQPHSSKQFPFFGGKVLLYEVALFIQWRQRLLQDGSQETPSPHPLSSLKKLQISKSASMVNCLVRWMSMSSWRQLTSRSSTGVFQSLWEDKAAANRKHFFV